VPLLKLVPPPPKLQASVLFEMTDEALHVKLVIGIILSDPANLRLFSLRARLVLTKIFLIKRQVVDFFV